MARCALILKISLAMLAFAANSILCRLALQGGHIGVSLDIENYCTIRTSPACQSRYLWFLSALQ